MKLKDRIQKYPMFRVALLLIMGILLGDKLIYVVPTTYWFSALVLSILLLCIIRNRPVLSSCLMLFSMLLLGGLTYIQHEKNLEVVLPQQQVDYEAVVVTEPVTRGKVIQFEMIITSFKQPLRVRASLMRDTLTEEYAQLHVGEGIVARSKIEELREFGTDKHFSYVRWQRQHGVVAQTLIYNDRWDKAVISLSSLSYLERTRLVLMRFRNRLVCQYGLLGLNDRQLAVVSAMTLGDKSLMNRDIREDYSIASSSHILAISGLHLMIFYGIITLLLPRRRFKVVTQCLILLCIWSYAMLVGWTPSVVRSATMITVYALASLSNRDAFSLNTLSVAAVIMLFFNPLLLWDIGFQMSFVAVLSIIIGYKPFYRIINKYIKHNLVLRWIAGIVIVTLVVQIGLLPLLAYYFGRFSTYFALTNIVVVPLATVILYTAVGLFVTLPFPFLSHFIGKILAFTVTMMDNSVAAISSWKWASMELYFNGWQVLFYYIALASIIRLSVYVVKVYKMSLYI